MPRTEYFLHPYTVTTRICILLLLLFCALAVSFIYYRQRYSIEIDYSKSTLYVLALFICQYQANFKIETYLQKLIYFLIFINGFILTNLYLAKLSSLFVHDIYEAKIDKLEDLNKTSHQLLLRPSDIDFLRTLPDIPEIIYKRAKVINFTEIDKALRGLNNTYCLVALYDKIDFLFFQQRYLKIPRMYKINDALNVMQEYLTVRRDSPFLPLLNRYLKYILESGILYKLVAESQFDGILSGEINFFSESESSDGLLLSFNYFYPLFCFSAFGLILSLIVFILEFLYAKYIKKWFVK